MSSDRKLGLDATDQSYSDRGDEFVETPQVAKQDGQTRHLSLLLPNCLAQVEVVADVAVRAGQWRCNLLTLVDVEKGKLDRVAHDLNQAVFKGDLVLYELVASILR